jgi:hypothetical protein
MTCTHAFGTLLNFCCHLSWVIKISILLQRSCQIEEPILPLKGLITVRQVHKTDTCLKVNEIDAVYGKSGVSKSAQQNDVVHAA